VNFRQRASELVAQGEAVRSDFTPRGVPLEMYEWWLDNSPSEKALDIRLGYRQENFCHFWRVVLIWVPLMWTMDKAIAFATTKTFKVIASLVGLALVGVVIYALTTTGSWLELLGVLALLVGVAAGIFGLVWGVTAIHRRWPDFWFRAVGTVFVVAAVGVLVSMVVLFKWKAVVGLVVLVAGAFLFNFVIDKIVSYSSGKRQQRLREYEKALDAYYDGTGPHPDDIYREPGRTSRFFSGVLDFAILIGQAIRVKKWKICPIVKIDA
jgi:hypothetical protein